MKKQVFLLLILAFTLQTMGQNISELRKIFDYDKGEDPGYKVLSTKDTIQGTINEVVFSSVNGLKVTAKLIIPNQKIREFPAVIFLNDPSQARDIFLPEALHLAENAFATLIIDALPDRPGMSAMPFYNFSQPRKDFTAYRQAVLDIRRAVDCLEQHNRIDPNRIAFIGSGIAAMTGAITSGVETRILTYMLMDCAPSYSYILKNNNYPAISKARNNLTTEQILLYDSSLRLLNPINYLPYHRNTQIFFQFSRNNPKEEVQISKDIFQITNEPKIQKFYQTTSERLVIFSEAGMDQINWLKNHL